MTLLESLAGCLLYTSLIAYQDNGGLNDSTEVTILNFMTGETQKVTAAEGENIRPLGFILSLIHIFYKRTQRKPANHKG